MKKQLFLLYGLFFCMVIAGCKKETCPAFPVAIANTYFPYTEGGILRFYNVHGDTLQMKTSKVYCSDSYTNMKNDPSGPCQSVAYFYTDLNIYGAITLGRNGGNMGISNTKGGGELYIAVTDVNPYAPENIRLFGDTVNLANEHNKYFTSMQIMAEKGIVCFFDKERNCEWVLIEDSF